ncbi:MAG: hypothetical protein LBV00_02695 [Propionibacteriaceae bacterium]|nr:hypothetical protein [Propionibacteriaceae bacterium]
MTRQQVAKWWDGLPLAEREPSCRQAYDLLRAIVNDAVDSGRIDLAANPAILRALPDPLKNAMKTLCLRQIIFEIAARMRQEWRLGVLLGGLLGMRSGEVRALRRKSFDLDEGVIMVRESVKEAEGKVFIDSTKTKGTDD